MDRKAWILLTICVGLLAGNLYVNSTREPAPEPAAKEQPDLTAPTGKDGQEMTPENPPKQSTTVPTASVEKPAKFDENPETLITKRINKDGAEELVEFSFTRLGGGVKFARFLQQRGVGHLEEEKLSEHEDKFVRLNARHLRTVGTLMLDPTEDRFDTSIHELVSKTDNSITFKGLTPSGLEVTKTFTLVGDSQKEALSDGYRVKLTVSFTNPTRNAISVSDYGLYTGSATPITPRETSNYGGFFYLEGDDFETEHSGYFTGGWFSSKKDRFLSRDIQNIGYAGVMNQFFATILTPKAPLNSYVWAKADEFEVTEEDGSTRKQYSLAAALGLPKIELPPQGIQTHEFDLYMGPKQGQVLSAVGPEHDEVMNYGWFTPVSWVLNLLLNWLFGVFGNWGWSIVAVTIIIRSVLWPIHNKSTRAMKRMQQLQPKMAEIKEKFSDDPQKMNMKVMELYRDYGVSPVGGCLPMLIQIPIFFGFYKMLMFAVELRNEGWIGWVNDLSQPDTIVDIPILGFSVPLNVLPILMAVTMVIQMKLSPKPADNTQAKIMMFMPVMFFFFCYNFASALALYWTTQNIFTIGQTLLNKRLPEPELKKKVRTKKKGGSFLERMAAAQEAKMKEMQAAKGKGEMRQAGSNVGQGKKKRGPKTGG